MLGTIINTGIFITLFAISAPFVFVLLIIWMTIGRNSKKNNDKHSSHEDSNELKNIAKGLRDLNRRIDNLETLNRNKRDKER